MTLILSGTDGLSDVDGSAATPAIRGTDANTGIFFGTDIIGFSEGGVEAMRINASGNVVMTGTLTTSAAGIAKASLPAGSVLQVVNATFATLATTTSSTPSDTGLSATITPTSSSSKILCLVDIGGCEKSGGSGGGSYMRFTLMRASTDLIRFEGQGGYTANTSTNSFGACSTNYLDSPSTTSATTYKVQFSNTANAGTVGFNNSSSVATMTLMEIAA